MQKLVIKSPIFFEPSSKSSLAASFTNFRFRPIRHLRNSQCYVYTSFLYILTLIDQN